MRTCEVSGCNNFVFGTDRKLNIGYCKNHQTLRTDISHESIMQKALKKQRKNVSVKVGRELRGLAYVSPEIKAPKDYKSKSQLLKEADRLFSIFIRNRDADKDGIVSCVCCGGRWSLEDKDKDGNKIIQCLHFVKREVYSVRHDEDNAGGGCTWCNRDMNLNPTGKAYQQFKNKLILRFGYVAVSEMELEHRKINKITEQQLKVVIEHYGNTN